MERQTHGFSTSTRLAPVGFIAFGAVVLALQLDHGWRLLHGIALVVAGIAYAGVAWLSGRGPRWPAIVALHLAVGTTGAGLVVLAPLALGWRQASMFDRGAAFVEVAREAQRWASVMRLGDVMHAAALVSFVFGLPRARSTVPATPTDP